MVVRGGVRFLMSEVPLYHGPHTGHWCCRHAQWGHYTEGEGGGWTSPPRDNVAATALYQAGSSWPSGPKVSQPFGTLVLPGLEEGEEIPKGG